MYSSSDFVDIVAIYLSFVSTLHFFFFFLLIPALHKCTMVDLVSAKINFKFDFGCEGFSATLSLLNYQTPLQILPFVIQFFASFSFGGGGEGLMS